MVDTAEATRRLNVKKQTLDDAYAAPANFLEIDILNPITHGVAKKRYTDYEVRMRTNLPVFKVKESSVRRRYSDFEWLRNELERDMGITVYKLLYHLYLVKHGKDKCRFEMMMVFLKRNSLKSDEKALRFL